MKLQAPVSLAAALALLLGAAGARGQGTFQNLGFESANLVPVPPDQFGGEVSSLDAIPYWTGFLGTNQVTQILHNNLTLGEASISILGPNWSFGAMIEGQYTLVLQPGADPATGRTVGASVSQTGLVPANAQSIQFKAQVSAGFPFSISIGGLGLSIVPLGIGTNYTLYGANIPSSSTGQAEALTITALAGPNTAELFDSFVFSSLPVPEPGVVGLSALGALVLGWRVLRQRR
jgi:hypothetical protein